MLFKLKKVLFTRFEEVRDGFSNHSEAVRGSNTEETIWFAVKLDTAGTKAVEMKHTEKFTDKVKLFTTELALIFVLSFAGF